MILGLKCTKLYLFWDLFQEVWDSGISIFFTSISSIRKSLLEWRTRIGGDEIIQVRLDNWRLFRNIVNSANTSCQEGGTKCKGSLFLRNLPRLGSSHPLRAFICCTSHYRRWVSSKFVNVLLHLALWRRLSILHLVPCPESCNAHKNLNRLFAVWTILGPFNMHGKGGKI